MKKVETRIPGLWAHSSPLLQTYGTHTSSRRHETERKQKHAPRKPRNDNDRVQKILRGHVSLSSIFNQRRQKDKNRRPRILEELRRAFCVQVGARLQITDDNSRQQRVSCVVHLIAEARQEDEVGQTGY